MDNSWQKRQSDLESESSESQAHRSPFSRDRSRIIHSAFFRRLQGKTQVLGLGESDFYRTRLTHSIEVAQISSGIVEFLENQSLEEDIRKNLPDKNLIEAVALAHDIGHPPFGHGGEVALNYVMHEYGGFEGNAQTLRVCNTLGEYSPNNGFDLTKRALLGIVKYPILYSNALSKDAYNNERAPSNLDSYKPPKCIFDDDEKTLDFVLKELSAEDKRKFTETENLGRTNKHTKAKYKGFDTSIMELADDIAYGVHDLEDAIALGLVSHKKWVNEVVDNVKSKNTELSKLIEDFTEKLFSGDGRQRKYAIGKLVNYFICSCSIEKRSLFSEPLLDLQAVMEVNVKRELAILQDFVIDYVIKTPEVQTLEYKGQLMLVKLFEVLHDNPKRLLPEKYLHDFNNAGDQQNRIICDYLAGTTDDYATRLYHKIFTPSTGSIFDRL